MHRRRVVPRACGAIACGVIAIGLISAPAFAQGETPGADHDHMHMANTQAMSLYPAREASGTAWLPQITHMSGWYRELGDWQVMVHGNAFLDYLHDQGARGREQAGSINWIMLMARHEVGAGRFGLRGMFSAEPWTIGGCGYPDLLASGERCRGQVNHDVQHPHDLFMEIAAEYVQPITETMNWQLYGGPAGEPALGPVAFPHRPSALANPLAPISHHWLDSTHIAFGVITSGVYTARWKLEGSIFNGREPDEHRDDIDLGALDSYSGRAWLMPSDRWALQVSAGHLAGAEAGDVPGVRDDVTRVTASATYHRPIGNTGLWATTVAWGRNSEDGESTHAFLAETSAAVSTRDTWYGRVEVNGKRSHDLNVPAADGVFTVGKVQAGYTRYLGDTHGLRPGLGVTGSAGLVPSSLRSVYGDRVNLGVALYLTLGFSSHQM
jgi:hypothetical protein